VKTAVESEILINARHYDLSATLDSGQAFRWSVVDNAWEGVVGAHWVRLVQRSEGIHASTALPTSDWSWLTHYLQTDLDFERVIGGFPQDEPMQLSVTACRGLRLLRQDPWECLASFILLQLNKLCKSGKSFRNCAAASESPWRFLPGTMCFAASQLLHVWRASRKQTCAHVKWVFGRRISFGRRRWWLRVK